jgi:peptidoglycan hydrolase CwlO-like protein
MATSSMTLEELHAHARDQQDRLDKMNKELTGLKNNAEEFEKQLEEKKAKFEKLSALSM